MDDVLRGLERAARAAPDDRAAGWALARALERAGDAPAAWRETCRLARASDDAAWEALEWRPRGGRAPGERVERRRPEGTEIVSAGPGAVVVASTTQLLALDPATLETRWSRPIARGPRPAPACAAGPWVVHVEGAEAEPVIVVTERRAGEELARRAAAGALASVAWADLTADRLVLLARSTGPAARWCHGVLSPLDGLVSVHQVEVDDPVLPPVLTRGLLLEVQAPMAGPPPNPSGVIARSLDGQERWRAAGALLAHPDRGVLLGGSGANGALRLRELDVAGRTRWSRDVPSGRIHLGPDQVVLAEDPYRRGGETVLRLSTLGRADGQPGWERVLTGPPGARRARLAVTGDVVYALLDPRADGPAGAPARAGLVAIDARSGLTRWTAEVPLVGPMVSTHAVDDGLLVVDRPVGDGDTVLHRLGAP